MSPKARFLGGFALISSGTAGLIAMNIWTVPTLTVERDKDGSPRPVTAAELSAPPADSASEEIASEEIASEEIARLVDQQDPKSEEVADAQPVPPDSGLQDVVTTRASDGTELPSIRFEPQSRAMTPDMIKNIEPIGAYLRHNFGMKVVLVGHGDDGMDAAEYVQQGRLRAAAVLRLLVDYGVSAARIGIELPTVEEGRVMAEGVPGGAVELRIEPRFVLPKKGDAHAP